ncbi:MAG: hypothetical protein AAGI44_11065 [Pseudomonadota bacterium]
MTSLQKLLLKVSAALWLVWGLLHLAHGFVVSFHDLSAAGQSIANAAATPTMSDDRYLALTGLFQQHGWNRIVFGIAAVVGAFYLWNGNRTAIGITAVFGGLTELGFFFLEKIPGYDNFVPSYTMLFVAAAAIVLSAWVGLGLRRSE